MAAKLEFLTQLEAQDGRNIRLCCSRKSISQAISDADDANWIAPEIDPVKEEEDRLKSIERTKAGFKRRSAAQSVQEKYRSGAQVKTLK